jgi:hypothetical protein
MLKDNTGNSKLGKRKTQFFRKMCEKYQTSPEGSQQDKNG